MSLECYVRFTTLRTRHRSRLLEHIVRLFQGQLAPISCATRHSPEPCPMTVGCTLREVWEEVRDATISLLGGVTFADLAKRAGGPWKDPELVALSVV